MDIIVDRAATRQLRPWGNKAGMASDLLVLPEGSTQGQYDLRIGAASIELAVSDFTRYPGYLRRHAVVRGRSQFNCAAGFKQAALGDAGSVCEFLGEQALQCTLQSPSAFALNIIHRPATRVVDALLQLPASGFSRIAPLSGGLRVELFYVLANQAEVRIDGRAQPLQLLEHDALLVIRRPNQPSPAVSFISPQPGHLYHATIFLPQAAAPAAAKHNDPYTGANP
ncbi:HutD family protein [Pseudomonas putida]